MPERRPLVEGLKTPPNDRAAEKAFVHGTKAPTEPEMPAAPTTVGGTRRNKPPLRIPFTSRVRADIAEALKRASLERQLQGIEPSQVQEILEAALEPWLRANGHLP